MVLVSSFRSGVCSVVSPFRRFVMSPCHLVVLSWCIVILCRLDIVFSFCVVMLCCVVLLCRVIMSYVCLLMIGFGDHAYSGNIQCWLSYFSSVDRGISGHVGCCVTSCINWIG